MNRRRKLNDCLMMSKIHGHIELCRVRLEEVEEARERAIRLSRGLLKLARKAVSLAHRGEPKEAQKIAKEGLKTYCEFMSGLSETTRSVCLSALAPSVQELVEATVLSQLLIGNEISGPDELGVGCREYLLGLADAALELRRAALDALRRNAPERAERLVEIMESLMDSLSILVFPDAILPIRHKVDALRSLIDRTRSDIIASAGREIR